MIETSVEQSNPDHPVKQVHDLSAKQIPRPLQSFGHLALYSSQKSLNGGQIKETALSTSFFCPASFAAQVIFLLPTLISRADAVHWVTADYGDLVAHGSERVANFIVQASGFWAVLFIRSSRENACNGASVLLRFLDVAS